MYKLVAIDCDNTLLDSTANIPKENKNVINILRDKGIKFILATGRNDILVKDYINELGFDAPVIGCNGASIRELASDNLIRLTPLEKDSLKAVFNFCSKNKIKFRAFSMTHSYSAEKIKSTPNLAHIINTYTKVLSEELIYETVSDMNSLIDTAAVLKIVIVNEDTVFIENIQKELKKIIDIDVVRSNKNCLDIIKKGVSKGAAVKAYAQELGIIPDEIIAFGDSENDYSMLDMAGFSVAMENGEDILKNIADMVTLSNDEAGVGFALRKIFKI